MRVAEKEREARFDALFAAYLADITAYCRWRAPSVAGAQDSVSPEADAVRVALGRMAAADQEVLLLAEWEGLSPAEIGTVLGCPAVTARGSDAGLLGRQPAVDNAPATTYRVEEGRAFFGLGVLL